MGGIASRGLRAPARGSDHDGDADGPLGRAASDAKFDRYADALLQYGISRWAVESADGALLGYCGVMVRLGLVRTPERDVVHLYEGREWPLLVWEVPAGA